MKKINIMIYVREISASALLLALSLAATELMKDDATFHGVSLVITSFCAFLLIISIIISIGDFLISLLQED